MGMGGRTLLYDAAAEEPAMRGILSDDARLSRNSLATSISARLARKLSRRDMPRELGLSPLSGKH